MGEGPSDDAILGDLVRIAADRSDFALTPFFSLVGAHQYLPLYKSVRKFVRPGASVLDWGAGSGHFSFFLAAAGYETTPFTLQSDVMKSLAPSSNVRVVYGDPSGPGVLPFPDETFDAIASVGVLEHVHETGGDDLNALREIRRVLAPGGVFLCYHLPNQSSWIEIAASLIPGKFRHERRYSKSQIRSLFQTARLEPVSLVRYGFLPRNFWGRTPAPLRASCLVARSWDFLDSLLGTVFRPLCQNFEVVARRQGPAE